MPDRWRNNVNSDRLYFLGLQSHCRWSLKPWNEKTLVPWKKSYGQPRKHIKNQRHYFANKGPSSQSYGFSSGHVCMWELDHKDSWVPKNRCFYWRRLLRVLWTASRSSQSVLKEISPEYSLEGLMLKLKLQYFGTQCIWKKFSRQLPITSKRLALISWTVPAAAVMRWCALMWRANSSEKTLMLGQIEGKRRRGR